MPSIIAPNSQPSSQLRNSTCSTVFLMVVIFAALYQLVHHWKEIIHLHPGIVQAMPLFGMATIAALLPLGFKLVYLRELAHLNPLIPTQYWKLCNHVYRTINQNDGKVSEKDL